MSLVNVRAILRQACEEIEHVSESEAVSESGRLRGITAQLRYIVDRERPDPEAMVYPDPDSLDTMAGHLAEIKDGIDDDDTVERLERAYDDLSTVVAELDESWNKQHGIELD